MKNFKRLLSAFLAVIMCVSVIPMSVFATTENGLGNFTKRNSYNSELFTDVSESNWFYDNVKTAYELGLMVGKGENTFDTESGVTIAETITIAARIHSIYHTGDDAFEKSTPWYDAYVDYAKTNGVLTYEVSDYAKAATRAEFAVILANALPDEALESANKVAANAIPDVKTTDAFGDAVYKLYRAGIMVGNDENGTFAPASNIKRSEVSAIVTRMADRTLRRAVQLGEEYTVSFDMNGHGSQVSAQTVFEGDIAKQPVNPTANNYKFKGWYTSSGELFDFSAPITGDVTLRAAWETTTNHNLWLPILGELTRTFTVKFESNGGSAVADQTVMNGKTVTMPAAPTKDNYNFIGWYTDAALTEEFDPTTAVKKNINLYAKWEKVTYTVSFETNGGSAVANQTVEHGKTATKPADPTKENFTFAGWFTDEALTAEYDFTTAVSKSTKLYAKWDAVASGFTVTFESNGGSAVASQNVEQGKTATKPADPTKENFTFAGWFADEALTVAYDFSSVIDGNIKIYAKWEKIPDELTLSSNKMSVLIGENENAYIYLETKLDVDSIDLYSTKDESTVITKMYDDGDFDNHGDDMAGDGIYSACISQLFTEDIEITFVAVHNDLKSNELKFKYCTVISEEEQAMMKSVDNKIDEIMNSEEFFEKTLEEKEEIIQDTLDDFVESGEITNGTIIYSDDAELFSFEYSNGVLGGVMIGEFETDLNGLELNEVRNRGNAEASDIIVDCEYKNTFNSTDVEKYVYGKAIILNSFPSFETDIDDIAYRTNFYNDVRADWNSKGLETIVDTDVTVSDYENLAQYTVVCISTHGSTYFLSSKSSVPAICLSEMCSKDKDKEYSILLKNKEIAKVSGCYWILPAFFENEYEDGSLENTFVFSECCKAIGYGKGNESNSYDYSMANAFINSSAKSYIGFHNSVFATYSREFMKNYIDKLIDGENSITAYNNSVLTYGANHEIWFNNTHSYTLSQYYDNNKEDYIPRLHIAYAVFMGDHNATLLETGLKNGNFEEYNVINTTPSFWDKVGDVRTLTQLGEVKPLSGGGRMAVISTGIGANSTNLIGSGTEGSIISQTFVLPSDAKKITFDYNLISEEPMEWVNSQYNDAFVTSIICEGQSIYNNILESINGSEWVNVSGIDFAGGDETAYQTTWKSVEIDVSTYAGKVISLSFIIYDVGDSLWDSACVIDNVSVK